MLGKLASLKRWLTLEDAAKNLSTMFDEPVSKTDLIQLYLEGQLQLSVIFPNPITAVLYKEIADEDRLHLKTTGNPKEDPVALIRLLKVYSQATWSFPLDGRVFEPDFNEDHWASGLWTLPMIEKSINPFILAEKFQNDISDAPLNNGKGWPSPTLGPVVLQHQETLEYWALVSYREVPENEDTTDWGRNDFFLPEQSLPTTASIGVSQSQLRAFVDSISDAAPNVTSIGKTSESEDYPHHLEALIIAWQKNWKNADRNDRTGCPKKDDVKAWLIAQGFSSKTADAGATIIKPQWAKDKGW